MAQNTIQLIVIISCYLVINGHEVHSCTSTCGQLYMNVTSKGILNQHNLLPLKWNQLDLSGFTVTPYGLLLIKICTPHLYSVVCRADMICFILHTLSLLNVGKIPQLSQLCYLPLTVTGWHWYQSDMGARGLITYWTYPRGSRRITFFSCRTFSTNRVICC